jgi:hypothetical protein
MVIITAENVVKWIGFLDAIETTNLTQYHLYLQIKVRLLQRFDLII